MAAAVVTEFPSAKQPQPPSTVHTKELNHSRNSREEAPPQTVDGLLRNRAQLFPKRHIVSYPSSGIDYVDYTIEQLDTFAYRVACQFQLRLPARQSSDEKPMVVALLGPSNFEYLVMMLALVKLGHTVLFLSTRISQEAIESLLSNTHAHTLLVDTRYKQTASEVQISLPYIGVAEIPSKSTFDFPVQNYEDTRLDVSLNHGIETSNYVYIIHSSGSTGLPKAIWQTHRAALANFAVSMEMKALITLPLYHNHGICNFYRAIHCGKSIHMYNADLPLTSEYLRRILGEIDFEIFYGVPYALKLLAETKEGIDLLRKLKVVMYGGSACPDELGDLLVKDGVNLVSHYGATEVGQLMTSFRPKGDTAWNFVREHERLAPFLRWASRGPNLFECCVLDGWPAKLQSNQSDGSYATKDLFEPHPTIPHAWKYIARLDDTIVLVNGEKFSPVQMEGRIRSNRAVAEAVVFGAGRPFLGLLVVPTESTERSSEESILDLIWPTIDAANETADGFAQISKSMVKILPYDCPCPRTDKGSIIRQRFYTVFTKEIQEAYDAADAGSTAAKAMDLSELKDFLHKCLSKMLSGEISAEDDTDFFNLGMDSLKSIQLRSEILRNIDVGGRKVGQNVVFDYPSVAKLSAWLLSLRTGQRVSQTKPQMPIETQMEKLVNKHSFGRGVLLPKTSVAITGATGSLGAHVAARLTHDPSIERVYCLVRAPDNRQALKRVKDSMLQRKVYHSIPLSARSKLRALSFDQSSEQLGLDRETYRQLAWDLRSVIHCAWWVNFNLQLSSFEDCITGIRNLLDLCQAADSAKPASFNFCSSVSTAARAPEARIPESLLAFSWAQQMGYAQSKSVAEHICMRAAQATGIKARVLRIGQIIGDTQHGVWNPQEAVPMMMQTAITIGALPRLSETLSWLPVDTVAQAVLDISLSSAESIVTNVANSKTFHWTNDLLPALRTAGLDFEEVEPKDWIHLLRSSDPDPKLNPPIKLLDFLSGKYDKDSNEFAPSKTYETSTACYFSKILASAPVLDQNAITKFVRFFLSSGAWKSMQYKNRTFIKEAEPPRQKKTCLILCGPVGSGKSTLGAQLATWLGSPFIKGGPLQTRETYNSMGEGKLLSKSQRQTWLERVKSHVREQALDLGHDVVIVTCSALKKVDRDVLRGLREHDELGEACGSIPRTDGGVGENNRTSDGKDDTNGMDVIFFDLQARLEVLVKRAQGNVGRHMSPEAVTAQVAERDEIQCDEDDAWPISVEGTRDEVLEELKWAVGKAIGDRIVGSQKLPQ